MISFTSAHFDHTLSSIERVLDALISAPFYTKYVKGSPDCTPPYIERNPRFFPYFKDCRGAIDGSHVDAYVPDEAIARYRNRKGSVSQNVLAICDFDMKFTYVLSGWEGSAADSTVYADARRKGLALPPGKYFLADAGFPLCDTLLTPYRTTRYHLREWGYAQQRSVSHHSPDPLTLIGPSVQATKSQRAF